MKIVNFFLSFTTYIVPFHVLHAALFSSFKQFHFKLSSKFMSFPTAAYLFVLVKFWTVSPFIHSLQQNLFSVACRLAIHQQHCSFIWLILCPVQFPILCPVQLSIFWPVHCLFCDQQNFQFCDQCNCQFCDQRNCHFCDQCNCQFCDQRKCKFCDQSNCQFCD